MANFIQQVGDRTLAVTFSGLLTGDDKAAYECAARAAIAKAGKINVLFVLKDFEGVGRSADMDNIDFYAEHADDIVKMAVVGDSRWKAEALLMAGAGTRKTDVRFFEKNEFGSAHHWITAA